MQTIETFRVQLWSNVAFVLKEVFINLFWFFHQELSFSKWVQSFDRLWWIDLCAESSTFANWFNIGLVFSRFSDLRRNPDYTSLVQHEKIRKDILTLLGPGCLCILWPGLCKFGAKSINQKPEINQQGNFQILQFCVSKYFLTLEFRSTCISQRYFCFRLKLVKIVRLFAHYLKRKDKYA